MRSVFYFVRAAVPPIFREMGPVLQQYITVFSAPTPYTYRGIHGLSADFSGINHYMVSTFERDLHTWYNYYPR